MCKYYIYEKPNNTGLFISVQEKPCKLVKIFDNAEEAHSFIKNFNKNTVDKQ